MTAADADGNFSCFDSSGSRLTCVFDADAVKLEMLFVLGSRGGLPRRRIEIDIVGHASPSRAAPLPSTPA